jgi:hypothetical protein
MISPARNWNQDGIGEVVIRQHDWPEDNTIILVTPDNARLQT